MTNGPIEFLSDSEGHEVPSSEYGGADGLIQPGQVEGRDAHTELTQSEVLGIASRRARVPLVGREQIGEYNAGEVVADPHTGRGLPPDASSDVTGKPGREHGLRDLLDLHRKPDRDRFPE